MPIETRICNVNLDQITIQAPLQKVIKQSLTPQYWNYSSDVRTKEKHFYQSKQPFRRPNQE